MGIECIICEFGDRKLNVEGLGLWVKGLGSRSSAWVRVYDVAFRVEGLTFRVEGLGFRIEGLGFRVKGLG